MSIIIIMNHSLYRAAMFLVDMLIYYSAMFSALRLGATNNVSKSLSPEEISEIRKKHLAMKQRDPEQMMQAEGEDDLLEVGDLTYLLTRSKLLIRNFLFLRVLITNGLLSPWDHGIGSKPLPKQKKIIDNLRMTASIFYAMLKLYQPNMAHVVAA